VLGKFPSCRPTSTPARSPRHVFSTTPASLGPMISSRARSRPTPNRFPLPSNLTRVNRWTPCLTSLGCIVLCPAATSPLHACMPWLPWTPSLVRGTKEENQRRKVIPNFRTKIISQPNQTLDQIQLHYEIEPILCTSLVPLAL
jgi:hypothetical protein